MDKRLGRTHEPNAQESHDDRMFKLFGRKEGIATQAVVFLTKIDTFSD